MAEKVKNNKESFLIIHGNMLYYNSDKVEVACMKKKVLLVVMDGIGFSKTGIGDAVTQANTPTLDWLLAECPNDCFPMVMCIQTFPI